MSEPNQREEAIFEEALALPPDQRAACLDKACGQDAQLRQRVEALLQAREQTTELSKGSGAPVSAPAASDNRGLAGGAAAASTITLNLPLIEKPGDRIGRYKLLQQIGHGGMGTVWMAEQEEPVRRKVALKLIKLGMDTKHVIARFEAERQALALMDHPNIAKVHDAGATATGRPYFVMELVKGVAITKYCDEHHLTPRQRLELFLPVCSAVQHAHQKGIIHRDLKPSNVLVTVHDKPVVKVIDFGVAKALG